MFRIPPSSQARGRGAVRAAACLLLALPFTARAQPAGTTAASTPTRPSTPAADAPALAPVIVTGNPLGSRDITIPASALAGEGLVLRRGSSLAETLDGLPGVSSSWFGPNANRPVIRGQDGDRVRILANGGESLDASALSVDHAVPIDPLVVQRLEVLRGPAALLHGGSAVGGVVNAIDNRIPREAVGPLGGSAELRLGGAADERGAGAVLEHGSAPGAERGYALHVDAFRRRTDDLRVPAYDRPSEDGSERRRHVVNSASDAEGGAVGGSLLLGERGYLGAAVDTYRNDYGVVAEDEVTIRLRRDKLALGGEWRAPGGPVTALRGQLQATDYEHREFEGAALGTTFRNRGTELRLEADHAAVRLGGGQLRGTIGLQAGRARYEALGEEAFVPASRRRRVAAFGVEEWSLGEHRLSFGLRAEQVRITSDGDAEGGEPRFGSGARRDFDVGSAALGGIVALAPGWQAIANLAYTERAPTYYELYADGVHVATGAYERGDPGVGKERGTNLELALQWRQGAHQLRAGAYAARYRNYIALLDTGERIEGEEGALPVYAYEGVPARLWGLELEGRWRLLDGGAHRVDLDARVDLSRAKRRDTGEALPRIAPLRGLLGLEWRHGDWGARGEIAAAARQDRVPDDDAATPGHVLVNLSATWRLQRGEAQTLLFAKLGNVGNRLAYNAATIATVRELAPLPGRSLTVGLRADF